MLTIHSLMNGDVSIDASYNGANLIDDFVRTIATGLQPLFTIALLLEATEAEWDRSAANQRPSSPKLPWTV